MSAGDTALACASLLFDRLVAGGLAAVCIAPGSRSTPLALAASRADRVPVHVHLDERSSAFFALGIAKATGRPVALVCTSGTAAANHYPAVIEASLSRVPLIVLTADRPPSLRGTGANQTIDQVELFGRYPRAFFETPLPEKDAGTAWETAARRALGAALGPPPGPVHINVPFDEPLVPSGEPVDLGASGTSPVRTIADEAPTDDDPTEEDVAFVRDLLDRSERGVVVAGGLDDEAGSVAGLAAAAAWPLLAEPISNLRAPGALAAGQHILSSFEPDVVLQVGRAPTTRATQGFIARARSHVVVETPGIPADPARSATRTIRCAPELLARAAVPAAVPAAVSAQREPGDWVASWARADRVVRGAVDDLLDRIDEPFEPRIARDVAAWIPEGGTLFAGNSMPVRDLDAFMAPRRGLRIHANRGASGIDGTVSTSLGIASVTRPVVALLGDLAMLHDASGLLWAARKAEQTIFVVPNNGGGAIFDLLPQASLPEHEKLFVTPHHADLHELAAAANIHHARIDHAGALLPALDDALAHAGCWLIEVPVDRAHSLALRAEVRETVATALATLAGGLAG